MLPSSSSNKSNAILKSSLYTALISFLTYACVFSYRKSFTVATFEGVKVGDFSYQALLILSQGVGYMSSKFFGIRFIAELKRIGRWKVILLLVGIAWAALLGFALVSAPWGIPFLFINGFTLGFLWGVVFSYVEGRRSTDFIGSAMAVSFIFAGGFSRTVAVWLRDYFSLPEQWLGFCTGLVFAIPLLVCLYFMEKIPVPDEADIAERTPRLPMLRADRKQFLHAFGFGLLMVIITYVFLTVMRDLRDNFMSNMWNELGYGSRPALFTSTETITSLLVLTMMALLVFQRKNILAFRTIHIVIIAGFLLAGSASLLFVTGRMNGLLWMQLTGLGLYMGYIPFNAIFFERMIASFRVAGNVGFLIYIADAWGYLGSMGILVWKEMGRPTLNWVHFYSVTVLILAVIGVVSTVLSYIYFNRKYQMLSSTGG